MKIDVAYSSIPRETEIIDINCLLEDDDEYVPGKRHLYFVLHASFRMNNDDAFNVCRSAIISHVEKIVKAKEAECSVITYAGRQSVNSLHCPDEESFEKFKEEFNKITTASDTCFNTALLTLMNEIEKHSIDKHKRNQIAVIFITAGEHGDIAKPEVENHLKQLKALIDKVEYAAVHCLGIGENHDSRFLTKLQRLSSWPSRYFYVEEPTSFRNRLALMIPQIFPDYISGAIKFEGTRYDAKEMRLLCVAPEERIFRDIILVDELPVTHDLHIIVDADRKIIIEGGMRKGTESILYGFSHYHELVGNAIEELSKETPNAAALISLELCFKEALNKYFDTAERSLKKTTNRPMKNAYLYRFDSLTDLIKLILQALDDADEDPLDREEIAILWDNWSHWNLIENGLQYYQVPYSVPNLPSAFHKTRNQFKAYKGIVNNIGKLKYQYQELMSQLDTCVLTGEDLEDTMQANDVLGINFVIKRHKDPKNPWKSKVIDVLPNFSGAESFKSAFLDRLRLVDHNNPTSKPIDTNYVNVTGKHDENFNACMPLYLFEEHWEMARHKMDEMMGLSLTLDPFGFHENHKMTVPFMVLGVLMERFHEKRNAFNKLILNLVANTCIAILKDKGVSPLESLLNELQLYQERHVNRLMPEFRDHRLMLARWWCYQLMLEEESESVPIDIQDLASLIMEEELRRVIGRYTPGKMINAEAFCCLVGESYSDWVTDQLKIYEDKVKKLSFDPDLVESFDRLAADQDVYDPEDESDEETMPEVNRYSDPETWSVNLRELSPTAIEALKRTEKIHHKDIVPVLSLCTYLNPKQRLYLSWEKLGFGTNEQKVALMTRCHYLRVDGLLRREVRKEVFHDLRRQEGAIDYLSNVFVSKINKKKEKAKEDIDEDYISSPGIGRAKFFVQTSNLYRAARALYGARMGVEFHHFITKMEEEEAPHAEAKIRMLLEPAYKGIRLVNDIHKNDNGRWNPGQKHAFRLWHRYNHIIGRYTWVEMYKYTTTRIQEKIPTWERRFPVQVSEEYRVLAAICDETENERNDEGIEDSIENMALGS